MKVYQAINAVSAALSQSGIAKGRKNTQQGYNFRGIDDVLNFLSASLVANGLVILPRVMERESVERTTAKGGALFYVTVKVEFDLVCVEDGSKHTLVTYGEAMDSADKATNKAMSAAYKYLALLAFCIPTEATPETDADYTTHEVAGRGNQSKTSNIRKGGMAPEIVGDWLTYINTSTSKAELAARLSEAISAASEVDDQDAAEAFTTAAKAKVDAAAKAKKNEAVPA